MTIGIVLVALWAAATASVGWREDDGNVESHQLGGTLGEAFGHLARPSPVNGDVLPLYVAELAQPLAEGVPLDPRENADPRHLPGLLCLGVERRKSQAESKNGREPDQPHAAAESSRTPRRAPAPRPRGTWAVGTAPESPRAPSRLI